MPLTLQKPMMMMVVVMRLGGDARPVSLVQAGVKWFSWFDIVPIVTRLHSGLMGLADASRYNGGVTGFP